MREEDVRDNDVTNDSRLALASSLRAFPERQLHTERDRVLSDTSSMEALRIRVGRKAGEGERRSIRRGEVRDGAGVVVEDMTSVLRREFYDPIDISTVSS